MKKNILLVAPNGTGKTVMALSALLPVAHDRGLKIIYTCRTHAQSTRVIKELHKNYSSVLNNSYNVYELSIRGRSEMCLNSTFTKHHHKSLIEISFDSNIAVSSSSSDIPSSSIYLCCFRNSF